ncbi:MAG: biosynthetic arginine decarboxylase [Gammaproteobacteria bacterium]
MNDATPKDSSSAPTAAAAGYAVERWGAGYFGVNAAGHAVAHPLANGAEIDLAELATELVAGGIQPPVLVRFGDILRRRAAELGAAFDRARREHGYAATYTAVYPIKVNQERHVVRELVRVSPDRLGFESGSKPELLAVLGLARRASIVIVNGYKDREYMRLALAGQLMGYRVHVVLEKPGELDLLLEEAERMNVAPRLGVRLRLASSSAGKWQASGGEKSKFGLTATELLATVERLRAAGKLDWLRLLHVHLGSQVANIHDIQRSMAETARFYVETRALGVPVDTVDVGGGLGVDYDGTASRGECSANYSLDQYAEVIVRALAEAALEANEPVPAIISESGRALTAHHAVLITQVIEAERPPEAPPEPPADEAPAALRDLWQAWDNASEGNPREAHADGSYSIGELRSLFTHGLISVAERARAETTWTALCRRVLARLNPARATDWELADRLTEKLADRLFVNLSVFQSLPDVWAINQVFPIMPLARLNEPATRRAILHDLTCDSDGRIGAYVNDEGIETTLAVHEPDGKPYLLGIFLVGAYQEILGDMHNLFGDTHAVNVEMHGAGYRIRDTRDGDSAADLLRYVHIPARALTRTWRRRLKASGLDATRQNELLTLLRRGLKGYTYLNR